MPRWIASAVEGRPKIRALVVLREHQVPHLGESLAVIWVAVGLSAPCLAAAVPPDLGIRTARPAAEPPPVVTEPGDVGGGY